MTSYTVKSFTKISTNFAKLEADFGPVSITLRVNESKKTPGTYRVDVPASKDKNGRWHNEAHIDADVYNALCADATARMMAQ